MSISGEHPIGSSVGKLINGRTQNISETEFKSLLRDAKGRLADPLGSLGGGGTSSLLGSSGPTMAQSPQRGFAAGISESGLGDTGDDVDAFSGMDALNKRVFSEIYSTIQTRLDQLKQAQASKESVSSRHHLGNGDVDNLAEIATKVAEYYAASNSDEYKKTAEKTLVQLIVKLAAQSDSGNRYAEIKLGTLVGKFPEGSLPAAVLESAIGEPPVGSDLVV